MITEISKAQEEVWQWKESLYEQVKNMETKDGIHYLLEKAAKIVKELEENGELKKQPSPLI